MCCAANVKRASTAKYIVFYLPLRMVNLRTADLNTRPPPPPDTLSPRTHLPIPAKNRLPRGRTLKFRRRKRHRHSRTWRTRWQAVTVAVFHPREKPTPPVGSILSVAKEGRCEHAAVVGACPRQREVAVDESQFKLLRVMSRRHRPRNVDEILARALSTATMGDVDVPGLAVIQAVILLACIERGRLLF